ncbi:MAG: 1,4-dihydroxy-2-naphthoate octaprenyltransferase [Deltaproteobacteria bacterium]|nr:1,4-dihydroxy-2-naphthoate octaprenyltransferase [Deltaproteobacteria bacterium]
MSCVESSQEKIWKPSLYLKALRAPFLSATTLPMILGGLLALKEKEGSMLLFALIITCGALINLATNTLNDYFDYIKGCDNKETPRTPFSGGSGLIVDGLLTTEEVSRLSTVLIFFAFTSGLVILTLSPANPFIVLLLGLGGIFLGYAYSAPPFSLSSRGLGELAVFLACGPLSVIAPCYIMSGAFSTTSLFASLPPGLMTTAILWINQFPDFESDRKSGKRNLLVRIGREKGRLFYFMLLMAAAGTLVFASLASFLPMASLWGLAFLIPLPGAAKILAKNDKNPEKLIPAMALTILSQTLLSIAMILAVII